MKDIYIYPALFTYNDDGISVEFPSLGGAFTCGYTEEEAIHMSKECLELHLYGMEEDEEVIPEPPKIEDIKLSKNQSIIMIKVYMKTSKKRHSIFYTDYEWQLIKNKALELDKSTSELVKELSLSKMLETREIELSRYIKETHGYAEKGEEAICKKLFSTSNYDSNEEYIELNLNEILQDETRI